MSNAEEGIQILGIDPGTNVLGYAVIRVEGKKVSLRELDVLKLSRIPSQQEKMRRIFRQVSDLIKHNEVAEMAIEAPFYGKNVQSMLKLGRSQGIAIAAGLQAGISIHEYSPKKIKQSVTGNGNASKEQVAAMVKQLIEIPDGDFPFDATDALATALCHRFQSNSLFGSRKYSGWSGFLKQNPGRLG